MTAHYLLTILKILLSEKVNSPFVEIRCSENSLKRLLEFADDFVKI